jgi:hypothetical protein
VGRPANRETVLGEQEKDMKLLKKRIYESSDYKEIKALRNLLEILSSWHEALED